MKKKDCQKKNWEKPEIKTLRFKNTMGGENITPAESYTGS